MSSLRIPLINSKHPGHFAVVDEEDFNLVRGHRWYYRPPRGPNRTAYAFTSLCGTNGRWTTAGLHRVIIGAPPGVGVDHKDGDGLNNRRANLRLATALQNIANAGAQSKNKVGYRGVYPAKAGHWGVCIRINGHTKSLGFYATAEEAARVYDAKAIELYGEFARPNFPEHVGKALPRPTRESRTDLSSRYRGVYYVPAKKKWRATITTSGKRTALGYFVDEEAAGRAYDAAARAIHGKSAQLNFPDP